MADYPTAQELWTAVTAGKRIDQLLTEIARLREQLRQAEQTIDEHAAQCGNVPEALIYRAETAERERDDLLDAGAANGWVWVDRALYEATETELAELVAWRRAQTYIWLRAGPDSGIQMIVHGTPRYHSSDWPCTVRHPDGSTECDWLKAHPAAET